MNIREYISTGILEAYVLGELPEPERSDVEKNLVRYPELREALARIEEVHEQLLAHTAIPPRTDVKRKLFSRIELQEPGRSVVLPEADPRLRFWKFAAAASITVALITSYLAYTYRHRWETSARDLENLITKNQQVARDYNIVNERLDRLEKEQNVVENPDFKRIVMKGTANAPTTLAYVYWNENSKEVYLRIRSVREIARENQYQLWAIIDGKPVDAGVFDGNAPGLIKMKAIGKGAATFAVTIEARGGKSSPSLETMQMAGDVGKS